MAKKLYPLRHLSVRVPWHDTSWDGRVCRDPRLNTACLKLKRIAESRDDALEDAMAKNAQITGVKFINDLPQQMWPCCVPERVAFMAPFEYTRVANHPYNRGQDGQHSHFTPTPLPHPPYSAAVVPFAWMLADQMSKFASELDLDVQAEREPKLDFPTPWVQDFRNQKALLDGFVDHLQPERSLVFVYAKQVPFIDDVGTSRILIGVGRVKHVRRCKEYEYSCDDLNGKLRSMLWEQMVQHSIRPEFDDGFILPYHAAIQKALVDPEFDPAEVAALSPKDRLLEFSHASQHVTNDGAIAALVACAASLQKSKLLFPGPWERCLEWVDHRLGELWKIRGPNPGLGAALSAFGVTLGNFVGSTLAQKAGDNEDPWPLVDKMFKNPKKHLPADLAAGIGDTTREKWARLPDDRKALLKLLSRFEIERDHAELLFVQAVRKDAGIVATDKEILANPYLIYESTRLSAKPVSVWTVDRGAFPEAVVRKKHSLPKPSSVVEGADSRRVRALAVNLLEETAKELGHTLISQDQAVLAIRQLPIQPSCSVDADLFTVVKDSFDGVIAEIELADGSPALQLGRLAEMAAVIRKSVNNRLKAGRLPVDANWRKLLDTYLKDKGTKNIDALEEKAREEKTLALKELAESRLSVLIGPAGTGKTTLLAVLCSHPQVIKGDILLLAPTGKARVRMEQSTAELKLKGSTIAQFLGPNRYDASTGRYRLSDKPTDAGAKTVIVDEASMLTEEMLAALLQSLKGVDRLILIGDPRQLPPIGPGRPFVDIIRQLAPKGVTELFPRVAPGYAELTIPRRQVGETREDLQLAEWFSGAPIAAGEDDVFDKVVSSGESKHVKFVQWNSADDLRTELISMLVTELRLDGPEDIAGFDKSLGGVEKYGMRFFNFGAAINAEAWQILSPVKSGPHGVADVNRLIHKHFRREFLAASRKRNRKYPKPMGQEEIVYGDKVINVQNTDPSLYWNRHRKVFPAKNDAYIANGEIGMAIGYFWTQKDRDAERDFRWKLEVEFSSQPNFKYDFTSRDFGEDGNPVLELAYALTVHKSQGSEFGTVILILPSPCRLLTRELLYTALTRQKDRVVILHQGTRGELKKYSTDDWSETARRLTNLFVPPDPVEIKGVFYEEGLIHRTDRHEMVRSKSEVIIADHLAKHGVAYNYEQALTIDGVTRYPDFTIEDAESGKNFYWEHCGMLHVPSYLQRWNQKLAWYKSNGILPHSEGGGIRGTLIETQDSSRGGISSPDIEQIIREVILG